jgi:hypothetical protein
MKRLFYISLFLFATIIVQGQGEPIRVTTNGTGTGLTAAQILQLDSMSRKPDSTVVLTLTDTTNDKVMTRHDLDDLLSNAGSLSDVVKMLGDSTAYFAFMLGRGIAVDTAVMVSGSYGGVFCTGQDSAKITVVKSVMVAGTGTEAATFNVFWGPVFGTAVDSLFTAAAAITTHTGESDVPNRHYKAIPPRNFVWGIFRGFVVGHRPTLISATIIYYIKRD